MADFPERLAEWLDTFDDEPEFYPATPQQVAEFTESWRRPVPESLSQLWLEFGSCRFDGEARLTGMNLVLHTVHGLDNTENGVSAIWRQHPQLADEGLIPVVADAAGNEIVWNRDDGSVTAIRYGLDGQRARLYDSLDELWANVTVDEWEVPDVPQQGPGGQPMPSDAEPLGLVRRQTVRHTFDHYLCFVLDTDDGQIYQGDLDDRGIGRTASALTLATADREVTLTLATAADAPEPAAGLSLAWHGDLESPTREIGVMDSTGLVLMYVSSPTPAPVRIWTNALPEPDEILVVVG